MKVCLITTILFGVTIGVRAQSDTSKTTLEDKPKDQYEKLLAGFSNPWKGSIVLNLHNYYLSKKQNTLETANTLFLRSLIITNSHLIRVTLPLITKPTDKGYESGIGNLNILDAIRLTKKGAKIHCGLGPVLHIPIASRKLGENKNWQLGIVGVAIRNYHNDAATGALITYRYSLNNNKDNGGFLTIQPVILFDIGKGLYGRSLGTTSVFDFHGKNYLVPLGFGLGKFFKVGNSLVDFFIEPGFTVYNKGEKATAYQFSIGMDFVWSTEKNKGKQKRLPF